MKLFKNQRQERGQIFRNKKWEKLRHEPARHLEGRFIE